MTYLLEPLGDQDLTKFCSGNDELDNWLVGHAETATGHGTRTYVLLNDESAVAGYFALSPHLIDREGVPRKIGRGAPQQIPGILLAKLALDESLQGQGLGAELLVFALQTIVVAAKRVGGRVVVVDAIDEAAMQFYRHHDFMFIPGNDRRLILKLSTAAKALGVDWP